MIWRQVDTAGVVTITKWRDSDGTETTLSLLDGAGIEDCSLSVRRTTQQFHPIGQRSPTKRGIGQDYRIQLNRGLEDSSELEAGERAYSLMALTAPAVKGLYATYVDANGTTRFAGWCQFEEVGDAQRTADFARQSLALINDGDPDAP